MSLDGREGLMTAPAVAAEPPFPDMIWVPGKTYLMGSDYHYPEERPADRVAVACFWMDRCPVTNDRFARFVAETGHVTLAEIVPDFCRRYRPAARFPEPIDTPTSHLGFRCIVRPSAGH